MGAISSTFGRGNGGVEVVDISSTNAYRYPPKSGNYFGSHFIMGGERFDMSQPESYLFGENTDLNFLGCKPIPFPYPPAAGNEPTKTLKSLVNIRKDSLRFVKLPEAEKLKPNDTDETPSSRYNLEFILDSDTKCSIKIFFFAVEEINSGHLSYNSKVPALTSEAFHYKRGIGQLFQQTSFVIDPAKFSDEEWQYTPDREEIPMVIQCTAEDDESSSHAHMTYTVVERSSLDGGYMIKPLKQKQFVHGLCYLLQEIYGIENKNTETNKLSDDEDGDDDIEDSGAECVICMSDMRDTLILPCRHLCLCSTCAESLRYQASSCPICRSPFRALLQIRAMRRKHVVPLQQSGDQGTEDNPVCQAGVPPGYEAVSLIEALNGPCGLPPPNTMEGIHVPPPSRLISNLDTEPHNKRRNKKQNVPVEMVKLVVADKEDKKSSGMKDEETVAKTEIPVDPQKSPILQKSRGRISRHRTKPDSVSLPRSASSDRDENGREDSMEMVNEMRRTPKKSLSEADVDSHRNLSLDLPPLTISSENLADDEREDTSEGEIEPEPDYDDCVDLSGYREVDSDDIDGSFAPPPDYSDVMNQSGRDSTAMDTEIDTTELDTDDNSCSPLKLHLSTTPHSSTDGSASSNDSSHILLAQAAREPKH